MKAIKVAIVVVWAMTMLIFLKREGVFLGSTHKITYYDLLAKKDIEREEYLGIYFENKKIGFSKTSIGPHILPEDKVGFCISNRTEIFLSLFDHPTKAKVEGEIYIDDTYSLHSFYWRLSSGPYRISANGERRNGGVEMVLFSGEKEIGRQTIDSKNLFFSQQFLPISSLPSLSRKGEYLIECVDPFGIGGTEKIRLKVREKKAIPHNGKLVEAVECEITYHQLKSRIYVDREGSILKAELPWGIVAKREDEEKAERLIFTHNLPNIASLSSPITIQNPRDVKYMKVKLNGEVMEIETRMPKEGMQIPISGVSGLSETPFVQCKDPEIRACAEEIIGEERDSLKASYMIMEWVYKKIKKRPTFSIPSAIEVLKHRSGDCSEHTTLFTALTRSVGIPTKMVLGLCYYEERFYYHNWCRVYCGEWIELDPTFCQFPADATHIPLIEGDIEKQVEVLGMMEDLEIEVIEYNYDKDRGSI